MERVKFFTIAACLASLFLWSEVKADPVWSIPINVKGDGTLYTLYFATAVGATDGYDVDVDEPHPPGPPGAFDAYFYIEHPDFSCLTKDARTPASNTWTLVTANAIGKTDSITWSLANIPNEGTFTLNGINMSVESVAVYEGNITKTITYTDTTPPSAPTGVSVANTWVSGELKLTWTNPTQADFSYIRIYRSVVQGQLGSLVYDNVVGTTKTDIGLTIGTTYYYTLRAVDLSGNESKNTDQYSGTPIASIPAIPIIVKGNGTSYTLYFGTHPDATDGYDVGIDEPHPPGPPGAFDAYFYIEHPDFPCLTKDMRAAADIHIIWTLVTANAIGKTDSIKWSPADLPAQGVFTLDTAGLNINMRTDSVAVYTGNLTLYIKYLLPPTTYTVSGTVGLSDNPPNLSGSIVTIDSKADTTDSLGFYAITGLMSGTYDIHVTHDGYYPDSSMDVVISKDTTINYTLTYIIQRDVGPFVILSPPDTVKSDSTYSVNVRFKNFGKVAETPKVKCIIDGIYADSGNAILPVDGTDDVIFKNWTVPHHTTDTTYVITAISLLAVDENPSNDTLSKTIFVLKVGIEEVAASIPTTYSLSPGVPNPATGVVKISYAIPEKGKVKITVYDIVGKLVATVKDGIEEPGYKVALWDMSDANGKKVQSGVYFYRLEAAGFSSTRKMLVIR
ncbi:MAG: T9SS type A sorting domain-containing protein [bacterium]|nr:T9SS type A sorting domain-containing protein [bacterium]